MPKNIFAWFFAVSVGAINECSQGETCENDRSSLLQLHPHSEPLSAISNLMEEPKTCPGLKEVLTSTSPECKQCKDFLGMFTNSMCATQMYLAKKDVTKPCAPEDLKKARDLIFESEPQDVSDFANPLVGAYNCNQTGGGMWWEFRHTNNEELMKTLHDVVLKLGKYSDDEAAVWSLLKAFPADDPSNGVCGDKPWEPFWKTWSKIFTRTNLQKLHDDFYIGGMWKRPATAMVQVCTPLEPNCDNTHSWSLKDSYFWTVEVPEMKKWADEKKLKPAPLRLYNKGTNCNKIKEYFAEKQSWLTVTCNDCPDNWGKCVTQDPDAYAKVPDTDAHVPDCPPPTPPPTPPLWECKKEDIFAPSFKAMQGMECQTGSKCRGNDILSCATEATCYATEKIKTCSSHSHCCAISSIELCESGATCYAKHIGKCQDGAHCIEKDW